MTTVNSFHATSFGRVHLRVTGAPTLPPLFLMHSNGRSAYEFEAVATHLADRFHVVAWDMPGHGDSDPLRTHLSIDDYAGVAMELCKALFDRPAIVGGSSIGALLALALGAHSAQDIAGIIAIELPLSRDAAWWRKHWPMIESMFGFPDEPDDKVRTRNRDPSPALLARLRVDRHKAGTAAMMAVMWAMRDDTGRQAERFQMLQSPTLFLNGDHGVATDAAAVLATLKPSAMLRIVENSGHFPQTDDPEAVARAIAATFGTGH